MNKIIVTIFDDESRAYDGLKALRDLHDEGSLTLYSAAVIGRDDAGKMAIKRGNEEGPVGTALGLATGSLIGALGGPAGVAVGASAGMLGGLLADMEIAGVSADFIDEVEKRLMPGKVAVVAEAEEEWITPLDSRMRAIRGVVYRRSRAEVEDERFAREIAALDAELGQTEKELQQANEEAKRELQAQAEKMKAKLAKKREEARARAESTKQHVQAKLEAMRAQIGKVNAEAKRSVEERFKRLGAALKKGDEAVTEAA